jgi:hypothetical protein
MEILEIEFSMEPLRCDHGILKDRWVAHCDKNGPVEARRVTPYRRASLFVGTAISVALRIRLSQCGSH